MRTDLAVAGVFGVAVKASGFPPLASDAAARASPALSRDSSAGPTPETLFLFLSPPPAFHANLHSKYLILTPDTGLPYSSADYKPAPAEDRKTEHIQLEMSLIIKNIVAGTNIPSHSASHALNTVQMAWVAGVGWAWLQCAPLLFRCGHARLLHRGSFTATSPLRLALRGPVTVPARHTQSSTRATQCRSALDCVTYGT